jgi:uncharacterized protein YoxC
MSDDKKINSIHEEKRMKISATKQKSEKIEHSVTGQFEQLNLLIDSIGDLHNSILDLNELIGALFKLGANSSEINFDRMPEPKKSWLDAHIFKRKEN